MKLLLAVLVFVSLAFGASQTARLSYEPDECPVVGNTKSQIYHLPGTSHYREMLIVNGDGRDNRLCFADEFAAQEAGYRKTKR